MVDKSTFIDSLILVSGEAERVRCRSLAHAWEGHRPLMFDAHGVQPSEVELIHRKWPGAAYYFFHPLWMLLAPVLRSREKVRHSLALAPDWLLDQIRDDMQRAKGKRREALSATLSAAIKRNETLKASVRHRAPRPVADRTLDIRHIHMAMLQLRKPQRDLLLEPSTAEVDRVPDLHIPWVRRCQSLEQDLESIQDAELIDQLAILLALALEAGLTGREQVHLAATELVRQVGRKVSRDQTLAGIGQAVLRGIRRSIVSFGNVETSLIAAQMRALPESWHGRATTWAIQVDD